MTTELHEERGRVSCTCILFTKPGSRYIYSINISKSWINDISVSQFSCKVSCKWFVSNVKVPKFQTVNLKKKLNRAESKLTGGGNMVILYSFAFRRHNKQVQVSQWLNTQEFISPLQHVRCEVSTLGGYLSSTQCLCTQAASMWPHHPKVLRKKATRSSRTSHSGLKWHTHDIPLPLRSYWPELVTQPQLTTWDLIATVLCTQDRAGYVWAQ